jgi:uncharacterized protein YjbI with pentapeptide repeats
VPVLSNGAIIWAAVVLGVVGAALVTVLLLFFGGSDHQSQHEAQLDAIKTAGTIVVGTGGAAALWLTARRQRTTEIALNQKAADQAAVERAFAFQQAQAEQARLRQERVDGAAEADAEARRITEQYGRAVDQLGSDKAAVRLGGLYALERLAHDNPGQRATIVSVFCAYLRMPYEPPGAGPENDSSRDESDSFDSRTQELQVRLAAQRIIAAHLRPVSEGDLFWPGVELDLSRARLIDLDMTGCHIAARFSGAQFVGSTIFDEVSFAGATMFDGANFAGSVEFSLARFSSPAWFDRCYFGDDTFFGGAQFDDECIFDGAVFARDASFHGTLFLNFTSFDGASLASVRFGDAVFARTASYVKTTFGDPPKLDSWVQLDQPSVRHVWPSGWKVIPSSEKPKRISYGVWGRLITEL